MLISVFPSVPELQQMAAEDVFVRLPHDPNLPRNLRRKVVHARHLLRYLAYAIKALGLRQDDLTAAHNENTMAGQRGKTALHSIHHRRKAQGFFHQAHGRRYRAIALFNAISGAQVVTAA